MPSLKYIFLIELLGVCGIAKIVSKPLQQFFHNLQANSFAPSIRVTLIKSTNSRIDFSTDFSLSHMSSASAKYYFIDDK